MAETLKACPFCGAVPKTAHAHDDPATKTGKIGHYAKIEPCCGMNRMGQLELFFADELDHDLWESMCDRLERQWNTRASVLCEKKPVAWMCPDDPERESAFAWKEGVCSSRGCGKQRLPLYAPVYLAGNADIGKPPCTHVPARIITQWDHGTETGKPFCIKCGSDISQLGEAGKEGGE